jgi:hypothetical protein
LGDDRASVTVSYEDYGSVDTVGSVRDDFRVGIEIARWVNPDLAAR